MVEENVITKAAGSINVTLFNTLSGITDFLINMLNMIIACNKGEMKIDSSFRLSSFVLLPF